jgi:hypothetical protein
MGRETNAPRAIVESIVGHSNPAMTRHYTHVRELAAGHAVAALPSILGETAAPAPKAAPEKTLSKARAIAESIMRENWQEKRAEFRAMLGAIKQ